MIPMGCSCSGCTTILALGMVGALVAGPRGLLLGMALGIIWAWLFQSPRRTNQRQTQRFRDLMEEILRQSSSSGGQPEEAVHALTGLFMAVIRQNDRGLREIHVQMAQQVLRVYAAQGGIPTRKMIHSFHQWESAEIPVAELVDTVNEFYPESARRNFLHDMMMVAFADGQMPADEKGILRYLSKEFGLSESEFDRIFRQVQERLRYSHGRQDRHRRQSRRPGSRSEPGIGEAYDTLNLSRDADEQQVKKQYRKMAREYHPDNYSGDDEEARDRAQEKMVEINRAYKRIMESM